MKGFIASLIVHLGVLNQSPGKVLEKPWKLFLKGVGTLPHTPMPVCAFLCYTLTCLGNLDVLRFGVSLDDQVGFVVVAMSESGTH